MNEVDLGEGWDQFWTGIGFSQFDGLLAVIGIAVFLVSLIIYLVKRSRNPAGAKLPVIAWIIAGVFAGPGVIIPLGADIVSALINAAVGILSKVVNLI